MKPFSEMTEAERLICERTTLWVEEKYTPTDRREAKKLYIHMFGPECIRCGLDRINPYSGGSTNQLHHFDGDDSNNEFGNLELLCPSCHAETPNYGPLNKKLRARSPEAKEFYRLLRLEQQAKCDHMRHWMPEEFRTNKPIEDSKKNPVS